MTDLNILVVIPVGPGWEPAAKSVQQLGCTGHPVWVSAAGVGEMLSTPGMVTRCVLHLPPEVMEAEWLLPESIKQQLREEANFEPTPEFLEVMVRHYMRLSGNVW